MEQRFLAFDIETATVAPVDASDLRPYRPLGISCAATFANGQDEPQVWRGGRNYKRPTYRMHRATVRKLAGYLGRQVVDRYIIVTWNGAGFDFDILSEESGKVEKCKRLARDHVDRMFHVLCQLGFGISRSAVAKGMGLPGKAEEMSGAVPPQFWAEGKRAQCSNTSPKMSGPRWPWRKCAKLSVSFAGQSEVVESVKWRYPKGGFQ